MFHNNLFDLCLGSYTRKNILIGFSTNGSCFHFTHFRENESIRSSATSADTRDSARNINTCMDVEGKYQKRIYNPIKQYLLW